MNAGDDCCSSFKPRYKPPFVSFAFQRKEYGITGPIIFNDELKRTHFTLDIIELFKTNQLFKKIGIWDPNNGINYTRTQTEVQQERELLLQNKHFIVASRLGKPFLHEV